MSITIQKLEKGSIEITGIPDGYVCLNNLTNVKFRIKGNLIWIRFHNGDVTIDYDELTTINGVAKPGTIEETIMVLSETVFNFGGSDGGITGSQMKYGNVTFELDGVQTVFVINHNLGVLPETMQLTFGDGGNLNFIGSIRERNENTITFTCQTPPVAGTQTVFWLVAV